MIALRLADNVLVFEEFDDSFTAGEHHLGHVEGLGDKVGRAQLEAADFGFLFGGHHDDRDALERLGGFALFQEFEPVHHGHEQVKQDKRELLVLPGEGFEGFLGVVGIFDVVFHGEDIAQNFAIYHLVVYNKDVSLDGSDLA